LGFSISPRTWSGDILHRHRRASDKPILPEPSPDKVRMFADILVRNGIPVKGKHLRGMDLPGVIKTQG